MSAISLLFSLFFWGGGTLFRLHSVYISYCCWETTAANKKSQKRAGWRGTATTRREENLRKISYLREIKVRRGVKRFPKSLVAYNLHITHTFFINPTFNTKQTMAVTVNALFKKSAPAPAKTVKKTVRFFFLLF